MALFLGGGIFSNQCPENVDVQLFKISIWHNFLQQHKRMLPGCNNYHKCLFNVSPLTEGSVSNLGRFNASVTSMTDISQVEQIIVLMILSHSHVDRQI